MGNSENHTETWSECQELWPLGRVSQSHSHLLVPSSVAYGYPKPPKKSYLQSPLDRFLNPFIYQVHPVIYIYISIFCILLLYFDDQHPRTYLLQRNHQATGVNRSTVLLLCDCSSASCFFSSSLRCADAPNNRGLKTQPIGYNGEIMRI